MQSFAYDDYSRMLSHTYPEGDSAVYTYDDIGNLLTTTLKGKPGSGIADRLIQAVFPTGCNTAVLCGKPTYTVDARGSRTDYSYNSSTGQVTSVAEPPPAAGASRPTTTNSYTLYNGMSLLTGISRCKTTSSCAGTADEVKTTIGYNSRFYPNSTSNGDINSTAVLGTTYDDFGNISAIDGPLAGTGDTTYYRYNASRQLIGEIAPDPDDAGRRLRRASRNTYDGAGHLVSTEVGTVADTTDTAWSAFSSAFALTTAFDSFGRPLVDSVSGGGAVYGVKQYSYAPLNRLDCVAVRMNSASWNSLPSSACVPQTPGSDGSDRITKYTYDNADHVTKITEALGATDQRDASTRNYTHNGKVATVTDGNGNVTAYSYDGFDRLQRTCYQVTTQAACVSAPADYMQLTYDATDNVTQRRLRDGSVISYSFDNLNRLTAEDRPNIAYAETDVSFSYDNLGRMTAASDSSGHNLGWTYDAFDRQVGQTDNLYPFGNAQMVYDLAGHRTRSTWADGFYVGYDYDNAGELTAIRENGATSGTGVLASFGYDDLGRRIAMTRGNGTVTNYTYDNISRLGSLHHNAGASNDDMITLAYNAADQITGRTSTNDAFAWNRAYSVNRPYAPNGLNQYTSAGAVAFGYDAKGNLASSGSSSYTFTADNLLATGPSVNYAYDALGRLSSGNLDSSQTIALSYDGSNLITETDKSSGALLRRYVFDPGTGQPVVWYEGPGTSNRRFLESDERGSIISAADSSGRTIGLNSYDEYGIPSVSNLGRFQYTGQAWLPALGLYYYKARIYSPTLGRFLQTDPTGYADGLNWYSYAHDDPVNGIDPTGMRNCPQSDRDAGRCVETPESEENPTPPPPTSDQTKKDQGIVITGKREHRFNFNDGKEHGTYIDGDKLVDVKLRFWKEIPCDAEHSTMAFKLNAPPGATRAHSHPDSYGPSGSVPGSGDNAAAQASVDHTAFTVTSGNVFTIESFPDGTYRVTTQSPITDSQRADLVRNMRTWESPVAQAPNASDSQKYCGK